MVSEKRLVFEGNCAIVEEGPGKPAERWPTAFRKVYMEDGKMVIERPGTKTTTFVPDGTKISIEK